MKKIHILGIAVVAMLAIGVVGAVSASAATLQWLAGTKAITTALASTTTGEITLGTTNGGGFGVTAEVLCSGIFVGTVGPGVEDATTEIQNLEKVGPITLEKPLLCTDVKSCETAKVSPVNLPWLTNLLLSGTEAAPESLDVISNGGKGEPGWEVECTEPLIGKISETCTSPATTSVLTNDTENDVLGLFKKELANCTVGGKETGFLESGTGDEAGLIVLTSGEALAVSYE